MSSVCPSPAVGLRHADRGAELYLGPQAQRHLSRVLRRLSEHGNQLLYSTHAPAFLAGDRLDELALVRHNPRSGTTVWQPQPLSSEHSFRALAEFGAERFLARAALLVEGRRGVNARSVR